MTEGKSTAEAVSLLQELGLQEYEARCFTALTQIPKGTAKDIHEISGVPRTRVYDAIDALESQGLVEVQASNPQTFRSIGSEAAIRTLRQQYNSRIDTLHTHLSNTKPQEIETENDQPQEVWALRGNEAIESRTLELIDEAESEIGLVVVDEDILSDALFDSLHGSVEREISLLLGGQTESIIGQMGEEFPTVQVFETGLDWLVGAESDHEVAISRILLVDRQALLVGSFYPDGDGGETTEQAVFAGGLGNGIVVLLRRLLSSGLAPTDDPGK